jgi:hypothetical protein
MQSTSTKNSQTSYQQQQQETQQDGRSQNIDQTNQSKMGVDTDGIDFDNKSVKTPVITSKPVKIKLDVIASGTKQSEKTSGPISPRQATPLPRLQLPESGQKEKSPSSPRAQPPRNISENAPQSPGRNEIIQMADSVADAYRVFGSPRKEQPKPRRLESRRGLDVPIAERQLEEADNPQKSSAVITTTTQISTTTTTTTTAQSTTQLSSVVRGVTSTDLFTESQSDFSTSILQKENQGTVGIDSKIASICSLPDESGYQPGEIFVKVRRKISMPKVFVPVNDKAATSSVQSARNMNYSRESQRDVLVDMLVAEYTAGSINPGDLGSISQNTVVLNINQLPEELAEFKSYLKTKAKPTSAHLIHALFRSEVASSDAWKEAIAIDNQFSQGGYGWTPRSGNFSGDSLKQLESMLLGLAQEFSFYLFGKNPTLKSLELPKSFKDFLLIADKKFVEKLIEQDQRALAGEKGCHPLSKKNIDQLRAYFFMNILVSSFMKYMLLTENRSDTPISMAMFQLEMKCMNKSAMDLFRDFQQESFENFSENLQKKIIEKSENELKILSIQKGRQRFLNIREQSSKRHLRSQSDLGTGSSADPLEEKARIEYQKRNHRRQFESLIKQVDEQLIQILAELNAKEFPSRFSKKIDEAKKTWFSVGDEVNDQVLIKNLLQTIRDLILDTGVNSDLIEFEQKLVALASENQDSRAKRRATMPVRIEDLEFLNAILDQTINVERSTTTTTNTTATTATSASLSLNTTTTTTTTVANPVLTSTMSSLPSIAESNVSDRQHTDS